MRLGQTDPTNWAIPIELQAANCNFATLRPAPSSSHVVHLLNALRQTHLPHPHRARYAVIGTRAAHALNYHTLINISAKHVEGITLRKTARGLHNNSYPLRARTQRQNLRCLPQDIHFILHRHH